MVYEESVYHHLNIYQYLVGSAGFDNFSQLPISILLIDDQFVKNEN